MTYPRIMNAGDHLQQEPAATQGARHQWDIKPSIWFAGYRVCQAAPSLSFLPYHLFQKRGFHFDRPVPGTRPSCLHLLLELNLKSLFGRHTDI